MASGSDVKAGGAYVEISTDNNPLSRGLNAAASAMKKFGDHVSSIGKTFATMGAAITAPLTAAAVLSAEAGAKFYDMSKRTGASVEALSAMSYAADHTGTSIESVEVGLKRMQKTVAGVADVTEGTTGSLAHLHIQASEIKGLAPEEQFALIASKIRLIADPTERAAAAMEVFGRSGTDLIPLIDDYDQLTDRAKGLGFVMTTQSATDRKAFSEAMADSAKAVKSLWAAIANPLIPILREKAQWMMRVTLSVRQLAKEHPQLIVNVFKGAAAVTAAGGAIYAFGKALSFAGFALQGFAKFVAIIASPLGLLVASVAGLGAYAMYASGAFDGMGRIAKEVFGGIADALKAGDIMLAGKMLWNFLQLGWVDLKIGLDNIFAAMAESFVSVWLKAVALVKEAWIAMKATAFSLQVHAMSEDQFTAQMQALKKRADDKEKEIEKEPNVGVRVRRRENEIGPIAKEINEMIHAREETTQGYVPGAVARQSADIERELADNLKALEALRGKGGSAAEREQLEREKMELENRNRSLRAQIPGYNANNPNMPKVPNLDFSTQSRSISAAGTFNPNAVFGIASGNPLERKVDAIGRDVSVIARSVWASAAATGANAALQWI